MDYHMDVQVAPTSNDMRYTSETSLSIDNTVASTDYFPQSTLNPSSQYTPDNNTFYSASSTLFNAALDPRPNRLGSNTSTPGITHAHRNTLPHPVNQISARDQYSTATPSHRRTSDFSTRSPSFPGSGMRRHNNISPPVTSPVNSFTPSLAMNDSYNSSKAPANQSPPLDPVVTLGSLHYTDAPNTPIQLTINGNIDKGFFLSQEGEWTCYRRNYFSCVCSYDLTPYYPNGHIQFTKTGQAQPFQVLGFAMCISAVVAENDTHAIELVQHTPKRDKGPIAKPAKIPLSPRQPGQSHHIPVYDQRFEAPFTTSAAPFQNEHTFERIQFKQATANNGKRRAAQQYYHLLIEVWADVGQQSPDQYIKVGHCKSAKMIVRGRSPGHYQAERRGSASSGPGGGPGGLPSHFGGGMMDAGFGGSMMGAPYPGTTFDSRQNIPYTPNRHHAINHQHSVPSEAAIIPPDEAKSIDQTKGYQYYGGSVYEGHENKTCVDMYSHQQRTEGYDTVNRDGAQLPQIYRQGALMQGQSCRPFQGKPKSEGMYPSGLVPQSGMNM